MYNFTEGWNDGSSTVPGFESFVACERDGGLKESERLVAKAAKRLESLFDSSE